MKKDILHPSVDDNYLDLLRQGKIPLGLPINCDLDNHLRFKIGQFNVILGHANTGKTYWIFWYFLNIGLYHNKRFLVFSSENKTSSIKRDLIQLLTGKKITQLDEREYYDAKVKIDHHFLFVDSDHLYSYKDLLDTFNENLDRFDCALIDPYNSLVRAVGMVGNAHEIDYQVASEFRLFCRTQDKTLYVIAHAATEALRRTYPKEHEFADHPKPPNASDIEGGGKWVNRADDFIVIHRLTQHPAHWMNTQVHVKKVKDTDSGGSPTMMDEPIIFRLKDGCKFISMRNGEEVDVLRQVPDVERPMEVNSNFDNEKNEDGLPF